MIHILVEYRRSKSAPLSLQKFRAGEYRQAAAARLRRELELRGDPDVEILILSAESEEDLQRTHSRYFKPSQRFVQDIAGVFGSRLAS